MPAYVIFIREKPIHNQAEMDIYIREGQARPRDPKLKPLAVYGAHETIEGAPADGAVILEFPTVEDAKAWYFSPEYQQSSQHRRNAAEYRGLIIQGF